MSASHRPMPRTDLLEANATAMAALEALIERHTPEELVTAHDAAGWTSKDHLVHLAVWLRGGLLPGTEGISRWEAVGLSKALYEARDEESFDRANEVIREQHRGDSLDSVLGLLRETFQRSQDFLRTASDADLFRPLEPCESDPGPTSVFTWLEIDGWGHFDEHRGYVAIILGDA
jgi:hypothetical protein